MVWQVLNMEKNRHFDSCTTQRMLPGVAADPLRLICDPTLVNLRIFNPQHKNTCHSPNSSYKCNTE